MSQFKFNTKAHRVLDNDRSFQETRKKNEQDNLLHQDTT